MPDGCRFLCHARRCAAGAAGVVLTCAASALAEPPTLRIQRVDSPPVLEHYLDGQTVPPGTLVSDFVQREPGDGAPISQETRAYVSYDAHHLYVVFVCKEDPARLRARMTKREAIMGDDLVGLVLDTYGDGRRAYLFLVNPLGIQLDGVTGDGMDDDYSYDTLWKSEGRITRDGYVVLVSIPFRSLRFSHAPAQTWGFAVARLIVRTNETAFWPYITRRIASFGQQLARLEGLEGISPGRNLQAIPYATFAAARLLDASGRHRGEQDGRAGLDAKAVVRDAVTLDLTANPDFSQVESDEPQVTINQRFEVFFPEKRPFFIENASYFEAQETLFFSRRIADPGLGARVTGKGRGWTFGGLVIDDRAPGRGRASGDPLQGDRAVVSVARVQRELPRQSFIGAIVTNRDLGDRDNLVAGADARLRLSSNWIVRGLVARSHTRDGDTRRDGTAGTIALVRDGRSFDYSSRYLSRGADFSADLGFIPRVDIRQMDHEVSYTWRPAKGRVLSFGPELETTVIWNQAGERQDWSVEPSFEIELPGQTEIGVWHDQAAERFAGLDFDRRTSGVRASTAWLRWLSLAGRCRWGTAINYRPAGGVDPFLGRSRSATVDVTIRPLSRLRVQQTYLYTRLDTKAARPGSPEADPVPAGSRIFSNHILRTYATYQLTRELSVRAIADYEAVEPDTRLMQLDDDRRLAVDVLATYLVNPWTAVYVGYTDRFENLQLLEPGRPPVRGGGIRTSVGRQIFVKVSYLLRY